MSGKKVEFPLEEIKAILETEFMVKDWEEKRQKQAMAALRVYESVEEFLEDSGWGKDNPELQGEEYLTRYRICRWVNGKFIYFSRLLWDEE